MRWYKAAWFFKIFRHINGITLGPGIVLSREHEWDATPRHWAHERCHVLQQKRVGWIRFYFIILGQYMKHGYKKAPYEVEARAYANDPNKWMLAWRVMKEGHNS